MALEIYAEEKKYSREAENTPYKNNNSTYSAASGNDLPYVVYQVTLKEKLFGTGSGNLIQLEAVINNFYQKGYRLHTMSTATSDSKGFGGGDRIQATPVFEKVGLFK